MRVLGYYIDTSKDQRRGEYTDPLCADHAAEFALAMGYDLDAEYCAPIFSDTESDSITVCYMCGEIIPHALTSETPYDTPISIDLIGNDADRYTVRINLYDGSARVRNNVSSASAARIKALYADRINRVQSWGDQTIRYASEISADYLLIILCGWIVIDPPSCDVPLPPSPDDSGGGVSSAESLGGDRDTFYTPLPDRFVYVKPVDSSIAPLRDRQLAYLEYRIQRASESGNSAQWVRYSTRYSKLLKRAPRPKIGMLATLGYGRDRIDFEVINVSESGKVIRIGRVGLTPLYYLARQLESGEFVIFWRGIETPITLDPRS